MAERGEFYEHRLENGIVVLGERIPGVCSAAFSLSVPFGAASDPDGEEGSAALFVEMLNKGAGPWNARELSEQFENIGVRRSHLAGVELSIFSGVLLSEHLDRALSLYGTLLLEPLLPPGELDSVRELALQELYSLEDEPTSKVTEELAKRFYPHPFGRSQLGTIDGIKAVTPESLSSYYQKCFLPAQAIVAVAGKFEWEEVVACVEKGFSSWKGAREIPQVAPLGKDDCSYHVDKDTTQVQIALASPSVSFFDPDYYVAKVAVAILSGGMFGRLFVEVREKRGLVYRVGANHSGAKDRAAIFISAGTTPENAEETLRVVLGELDRLGEGVTEEELRRAKVDLKTRLVMQGEHTSVRASSLLNDWWNMGRIRTLDEMLEALDRVTAADIERFAREHPFSPKTLVSLGPKKLELPR